MGEQGAGGMMGEGDGDGGGEEAQEEAEEAEEEVRRVGRRKFDISLIGRCGGAAALRQLSAG